MSAVTNSFQAILEDRKDQLAHSERVYAHQEGLFTKGRVYDFLENLSELKRKIPHTFNPLELKERRFFLAQVSSFEIRIIQDIANFNARNLTIAKGTSLIDLSYRRSPEAIHRLRHKLLHHPETLLERDGEDNFGFMLKDPEWRAPLGECHCCSQYNRAKQGADYRQKVVDYLVGDPKLGRKGALESLHSPMNKAAIKVLSIGSGMAFQELVIHAHLTELGYKKIEWILIDQIYGWRDTRSPDSFQMIAQQLHEKTVVTIETDVDHFFSTGLKVDLMLVIDGDWLNYWNNDPSVNKQWKRIVLDWRDNAKIYYIDSQFEQLCSPI
jgi:hypothetical protein